MTSQFSQHKAVAKELSQVWGSYGRLRALLASPFFHVSVVISVMSSGAWLTRDWWTTGMSVVPALLGFSVATFAVFVAIGDDKFRTVLASGGHGKVRALVDIYSSFLMLIGVQVIGLLLSLIASSRPLTSLLMLAGIELGELTDPVRDMLRLVAGAFRFIGWLFVIYSVIAVIPMSLSVYRMAKLYLGHLLKGSLK